MQSEANTVKEYLAELPPERLVQIQQVRDVILANLPAGYEEVMNWGMITYQVPLTIYPDTYNKKPLLYAALASQKNHMAVYLSGIYMYAEKEKSFKAAYEKTGKRYDVGKSCVRFKTIDDLPLDLIGETIAAIPLASFVDHVKALHSPRKAKS